MKLKYKDRTIPALNRLFYTYKRNSKIKRIEFNLSINLFKKITSSRCIYCGKTPTNIVKDNIKGNMSSYQYNGIDRVDNTLGYTTSNCVPCCKLCNYTKNNLTQKNFMDWIKRVVGNIEKIKTLHITK